MEGIPAVDKPIRTGEGGRGEGWWKREARGVGEEERERGRGNTPGVDTRNTIEHANWFGSLKLRIGEMTPLINTCFPRDSSQGSGGGGGGEKEERARQIHR